MGSRNTSTLEDVVIAHLEGAYLVLVCRKCPTNMLLSLWPCSLIKEHFNTDNRMGSRNTSTLEDVVIAHLEGAYLALVCRKCPTNMLLLLWSWVQFLRNV
jgi:hypothetical protein